VRYESARAFRTALEQRLKSQASDRGVPVGRLRKRVSFERYLARLQQVAPDAWVLKGGFALELRLGDIARTTKDIDVDWKLGESDAIELLLDAAATDLDDFFTFNIERAQADPDLEGQGQRWRLRAELGGREFETVLVDIGLDKSPVLKPVRLELPKMLDFADVPSVKVPSLGLEQHLAEKVHAYTRTYGRNGKASSRVKDLVDIALVGVSLTVDGKKLKTALAEIFRQRATHDLPPSLPAPPEDWTRAWREQTQDLPVPGDPGEGHHLAAALIDPILSGERSSGHWSPDTLAWQ
jgi:hypothetical protein